MRQMENTVLKLAKYFERDTPLAKEEGHKTHLSLSTFVPKFFFFNEENARMVCFAEPKVHIQWVWLGAHKEQ